MWLDCVSMGGFRFFPFIFMLLIGFIIYSIFTKTKKISQTSLDVLNTRYARGEISQDEYNNIKKDTDV